MEDGTEFLRYVDFPEKFVYVQKEKKWKPRVNRSDTIGRIHSVSPASGDVFYLRMLLHDDHCRGKVSFTDLCTLPGEETPCETYKEVCRRLGFLQDDKDWDRALTDAALTGMCRALREFFVTILMFCGSSNPSELFENHWEEWVDDFQHRAERRGRRLSPEILKTRVLTDIEQRLQSWEKSLRDFGLPIPTPEDLEAVAEEEAEMFLPPLIREELDYDWEETKELAERRKGQYTAEQMDIYNMVMEAVSSKLPLCLFISARGGCGKSFLSNACWDDLAETIASLRKIWKAPRLCVIELMWRNHWIALTASASAKCECVTKRPSERVRLRL